MPGPNPTVTAAATDTLTSQAQPGVAADQAALAAYEQQLGSIGDQTQAADTYAQTMAGYQLGQQGISEKQLGLQGQGLALSEQGQAMAHQLAGIQQGYEVQEFGAQKQQNLENYMDQMKNLQGQQAASGSLGAPGQARDTANLSQNFQTSSLLANLGQASEVAGYQEKQGGGVFGAGEYGLTQQQNALSQQNLSLMAQANGLSEQELVTQLNQSLAQNKQSGITSVAQLLGTMGNLATGDISTIGAAAAPLGYSSNINMLTAPPGA
jgi:hypothetical protein